MKKNYFYGLLVLAIFAVIGCSDSFIQEPTLPLPEQQKEMTHEVTQAEARQQLEEILLDMKIPSTRGTMSSVPNITSAHTIGKFTRVTRSTQEVEPYFHIFNFGDNEGFAIMSGDDRVEPLLALTYKGELTPDTEIESPNFQLIYSRMEKYYEDQVLRGGSSGLDPDPEPLIPVDTIVDWIDVKWVEGEKIYEYYEMPYGHCPVEWGQTYPYNKYCFTSDNRLAFTGCVATAVAQLMAIYKYPPRKGIYSYHWDLMVEAVIFDDSSVAINSMARLMQQLGLSENLNVDYGAVEDWAGSSANPENIPRTLENFKFTNGGQLVPYNNADVLNELKNGYPLLIGGHDDDSGHRWLGHGLLEVTTPFYLYDNRIVAPREGLDPIQIEYDIDQYILCDMGWEGYCNGYYYTGYFDTNIHKSTRSVEDGNYSNNLSVVIGIRK